MNLDPRRPKGFSPGVFVLFGGYLRQARAAIDCVETAQARGVTVKNRTSGMAEAKRLSKEQLPNLSLERGLAGMIGLLPVDELIPRQREVFCALSVRRHVGANPWQQHLQSKQNRRRPYSKAIFQLTRNWIGLAPSF